MQKRQRTTPTTDSTDESLGNHVERMNDSSAGNGRALNDSVAQRAYQRYEERGREHGRALDDWLEAERELLNKEE
jgi:hypothetical protein